MPVNYDEVLADLRQMKADAEAGITAIERLMARSGIAPNPKVERPGPVSATLSNIASLKPWNDTSVPQRVANFLNAQPTRSFTIAEIVEGTGVKKIQTLRGALGRMLKSNPPKAAKQGRGHYRAPRPKSQTSEQPV